MEKIWAALTTSLTSPYNLMSAPIHTTNLDYELSIKVL